MATAIKPATGKIGIGSAISRVDGVEKVTGTARYAAEYPVPDMLYGFIVDAAGGPRPGGARGSGRWRRAAPPRPTCSTSCTG